MFCHRVAPFSHAGSASGSRPVNLGLLRRLRTLLTVLLRLLARIIHAKQAEATMYESRRFAPRKYFGVHVDPVMLAALIGVVLFGCGILVGHVATIAVESAAEIQAAIYR